MWKKVLYLLYFMCHNSYQQDYRRQSAGLTEVPSDIPEGTQRVILRYNNIQELRADTFSHLYQCTSLSLYSNSISVIEAGAFRGLIKLEKLFLDINKIQEIRADMWEGLPSLKILGFSDNYITVVPKVSFQTLFNLVVVDFNRNQFPTVEPENFSELGKLQELLLRANDLVVIRGNMWIGLESLTYLDLYENKITVIEKGGFANLPMIETIELRHNKLNTLSQDAFCLSPYHTIPHSTVQPSKLTLLLDGIDLFCDSRLCWLKQAENNGLITLSDLLEFEYSPPRVECVNFPGVSWDEAELNCTDVEIEWDGGCEYEAGNGVTAESPLQITSTSDKNNDNDNNNNNNNNTTDKDYEDNNNTNEKYHEDNNDQNKEQDINSNYIGIFTGVSAGVALLIVLVVFVIVCKRRGYKCSIQVKVAKETKPDGEERLPPPLSTTDDTVYCDINKHDVNVNEDVYEGINIDGQWEEEYIEDEENGPQATSTPPPNSYCYINHLNVISNEYDYAGDDGTIGRASSDGYLEAVNQDLAPDYQELEKTSPSIGRENQSQSPSLSSRSSEYGDINPPDVSTNGYDYAAEDGYIKAVNRDIVPDYQEVAN